MEARAQRSEWVVALGVGLTVLGVWLLAGHVLAPLLWPVAWALRVVNRAVGPIVLIAIGALLVTRRRRTMNGTQTHVKRLYRSRTDRMVGGVVGGAAAYLGVDATILRLLYVVLTLVTWVWAGLLFYIIAMIVVPEEPLAASAEPAQVPPAPPIPEPPAPPVLDAASVEPPAAEPPAESAPPADATPPDAPSA